MKNFSITNGTTWVDLDNVNEKEKMAINDWEMTLFYMDFEDIKKTNEFTEADVRTIEGKIQYIKDYLTVSDEDLVIG